MSRVYLRCASPRAPQRPCSDFGTTTSSRRAGYGCRLTRPMRAPPNRGAGCPGNVALPYRRRGRVTGSSAVWVALPPDDADFTNRWRLIKQRFPTGLSNGERRSAVRSARGERGIEQRRFWEHAIRDDTDYAAHVDYCHLNPVKQGFVQRAVDWPYSTFHRYVERGIYPLGWACGSDFDVQGGERG
jgi:putative transposase